MFGVYSGTYLWCLARNVTDVKGFLCCQSNIGWCANSLHVTRVKQGLYKASRWLDSSTYRAVCAADRVDVKRDKDVITELAQTLFELLDCHTRRAVLATQLVIY